MGTKQQPGEFDCYANARPDEPMFILLARDADAAEVVEVWCSRRASSIDQGARPKEDRRAVVEALQCARDMREWRAANNGKWRDPKYKREIYRFDNWSPDEDHWNTNTSEPGIMQFAEAIQVWDAFQNRSELTSVAEVARAFNCEPHRVVEAVKEHPWMFLQGPDDDYERLVIYHEGE